jgi:Uma2 family endonuclease
VREVWVIDAKRATIWVHRHLGAQGYAEVFEHGGDERVSPMLAPELAFSLSEIGVRPLAG